MNDYKKLIKRLRVAVDVHEVKGCVLEISAETCTEIADAIEQLVKERDAAVADLKVYEDCSMCKNYCGKRNKCTPFIDNKSGTCDFRCVICKDCDYDFGKWEWRGVQE